MIPKIITIHEGTDLKKVIDDFADENGIMPSHRIIVLPEKDELKLEQIHLMQRDTQVMFSHLVLVVLLGVDESSGEVQNALLKSLEEEGDRIQFLLVIKNPSRLLTTILSRSSLIDSHLEPPNEKRPIDTTGLFSFRKNTDATKEDAATRIDEYIMHSQLKSGRILRHLLSIRKLIVDNNMNPQLALDNILIFLSKTSTMNTHT